MANWFKSIGIIRYDPPRGTMKNRVNWWCVIEADREITRYYRYWVNKTILNPLKLDGQGLYNPAWDAHVSIVRGEHPPVGTEHLWKKYDGQRVEFEYCDEVYQTGQNPDKPRPDYFWAVMVRCPLAFEIRDSFNLRTTYNLHLTIGRTY